MQIATATPSNSNPARAVFFGTGDIARPAFAALCQRPDIKVVALVTQPDKPVGRHLELKPPAIKMDALAHGIPVFQPEKARNLQAELADLNPDIFMVMAYGQILPQTLIDLPRLVCWNLHASLLPRHRGASPIQAAILTGDSETGITVMHMAKALDAGDIVLAEKVEIQPDETGGSLHDRLAQLAPQAMNQAISLLFEGKAPRYPQNPEEVTVQGKLERADGAIDWTLPAAVIARQIRAFDPWPGTFTHLPDGKALKIYPPVTCVESISSPSLASGTLIADPQIGIAVVCGKDLLAISQVQPDGKRRMDASAFLNGNPQIVGKILS